MCGEQGLYFTSEFWRTGAGLVQEPSAGRTLALQRRAEDLLDLPPSIGPVFEPLTRHDNLTSLARTCPSRRPAMGEDS